MQSIAAKNQLTVMHKWTNDNALFNKGQWVIKNTWLCSLWQIHPTYITKKIPSYGQKESHVNGYKTMQHLCSAKSATIMHYAATIMHYSQQKKKVARTCLSLCLSKLFHKPLQRSFMSINTRSSPWQKGRRVLTKEITTQIVETKSNKTISSSKTKRKKCSSYPLVVHQTHNQLHHIQGKFSNSFIFITF
jgi:hypothetical protein